MVARALLASGLTQDDLVATDSTSDIEYLSIFFGALKAGTPFMSVQYELRTSSK